MKWHRSHRFDPPAVALADRHYSRQKPGSPQCARPGRCLVLLTECQRALWISSWQYPEFEHHAWPGAWQCALFRNEGAGLSSELILEAEAATRAHWGEPPALGFITFVDPGKTRRKRDPGRCFRRAGWHPIGETQRGLIVLQHPADEIPQSVPCEPMTVYGLPLFPIPSPSTLAALAVLLTCEGGMRGQST
jgi:hypothetical protein